MAGHGDISLDHMNFHMNCFYELGNSLILIRSDFASVTVRFRGIELFS